MMLEIDGKSYETRFNYGFAKRLMKDYGTENVDGFSHLINQIIDSDPMALVNGYRYSLDTKSLPSDEKVADALEAAGVFDKGEEAFSELFKAVKSAGFLTLQLNLYVSSKENVVEDAKKVLANLSNEEDKQGAEIDLAAAETSLARIKKAIKKLSK